MSENKTWRLKLISVIMAILLWLFITNESVIIQRQTVSGVKLNAINTSAGLTASYPEDVSVSIVGTPRNAQEINAYVDLNDKGVGVYELPVKVRPMTGARVSSITPAEVRVEIVEIQEFVFPVSYRISKQPPSGYKVAGVEVTPAKCVVRGSRQDVNRISSLTALLDLSALKDTGALRATVIALDRNQDPIEEVQILPSQVQVYVAIEKSRNFGKATVNASLTGTPAEGYEAGQVTIEPLEVTLLGAEAGLTEVSAVNTKPIDLTGRDRSFQQEVELEPVPEVSVFPSTVLVMIEIEKKEGPNATHN